MTDTIPASLTIDSHDDEFREWLAYLSDRRPRNYGIHLPAGEAFTQDLRYLDVPEEAIPSFVQSRPDPEANPDAWWLLEHCASALVDNMGVPGRMPGFRPLPPAIAKELPHLYVHVFVAALPHVRAYHASLGVPERVTRESLADLGRNVRVHQKWHGEIGLGVYEWISLHFRGLLFDLGRLQFERTRMRPVIADALRENGVAADPDEIVLSLHIPDYKGPLAPDAVDASIGQARAFFSAHFPDEAIRYAVCHSWLLDPQLADHLSEASNIVSFQRRFQLADHTHEADASIVRFVFGPVPEDPRDLPARSSLERAIRNHLIEGGHWYARSGWFPWR